MTAALRLSADARPRVVCITQARMNSSRLPGKVLQEAAGRPLLAWHLERLRRCRMVDAVVLATTVSAADDPVAALAASLGVAIFRGSEEDVLDRFAGAAREAAADVIVRVTADCPLIDPALIDVAVGRFLAGWQESPPVDYVAIDTTLFPRGLDGEVFSRAALEEAHRAAADPAEREHVTPYIYRRPDRFRMAPALGPPQPLPVQRWCVDEASDLELIRRMLGELLPGTPDFGWQDCCRVMQDHPEWSDINRGVLQRKLV